MATRSSASLARKPESAKKSDLAPTGFSRADIVGKTMDLLVSHWTDDLSFSQIAEALGTTSATLHYFYGSREAWLNDVADHAFAGFKPPKTRAKRSWQEELSAWLWAVEAYCAENPVALRAMAFEGRVSDAWLRVTAPVWRILRSAGLGDRALAFATTWFLGDAMGQIMAEFAAPASRRPAGLVIPASLAPQDQENLKVVRRYLHDIDGRELLEFGFAQLIKGVEELVARYARPDRKEN